MSKKLISVLLSLTLLLSLFTVFISADEATVSPVMKKEFSTLLNEIRGFIQTGNMVIKKDDWQNVEGATGPVWQTEKLQERVDKASALYVKYSGNKNPSQDDIKTVEDFLLQLYGGWDPEWETIEADGTKSYGAYIGGNLPYSPVQNALYLRSYAFDNYVARDEEYGYDKLTLVLGEATGKHLIVDETKPEVIINVDGEDIIARGKVLIEEKDENGKPVLVRNKVKDGGIYTNPGQYTIDSWYKFSKQIIKTTTMMVPTTEFPQSELATLTRSTVNKKLDEYRAAYDQLELIPSETDTTLTEEQKAEKREENRLRSIIFLMLEIWEDPKADSNDNKYSYRFTYEDFLTKQDGSTTQEKIDEVNKWFVDNEISYKLPDLSLDETKKDNVRAWLSAAEAAAKDENSTKEELLKFVNLRERYTDDEGSTLYVDDAEDPAKVRAEKETVLDDYTSLRDEVLSDFANSTFTGTNYRNTKNAIINQATSDYLAGRYKGADAEYQALYKSCETGDALLNVTWEPTKEASFWGAIQEVMTAYEALVKLRSNDPVHMLIYNEIEAFMADEANKALYTEESWKALEDAVAAYRMQVTEYDAKIKEIDASDMTDAEKAEATAAELEKLNVKAYTMNEKYKGLVLVSSKVTSNEILNAARAMVAKAQLTYDFLEGEDMPYTQESFARFQKAYLELKTAVETVTNEITKNSAILSYGDQDLLALIVNLVTAQAGLVYSPDTCND